MEVIKKADLILLEQPSEREYWKDFIGDKEVIYCPHGARVGLGLDPKNVSDPDMRAIVEKNAKHRQEAVDKNTKGRRGGKDRGGAGGRRSHDLRHHFLSRDAAEGFSFGDRSGHRRLSAVSAAVKMSPVFGYDTNSVIVTMDDWPGRKDVNEKLMATQTSMIIYTMDLNYPRLFEQLKRHYPLTTPVAVVSFAGDREKQQVVRSTVGRFLTEVDYKKLPVDAHTFWSANSSKSARPGIDALLGRQKANRESPRSDAHREIARGVSAAQKRAGSLCRNHILP